MGFGKAVASVFTNYFNFSGRAGRAEYWYFCLFMLLAAIVTLVIDIALGFDATGAGPAYIVYALGTLIPSFSVSVRRLHDVGRSGWWVLLVLTVIGMLVLLYWAVQRGETGSNQYGSLQAA
jgi:uncharacterized membrane protein YhaH (DUF805 family)